jgi:hypothetical protein
MDDLKALEQQIRDGLKSYGIQLPDDLEEFNKTLLDMWEATPPTEKELAHLMRRSQLARENFTVAGFKHFYWCIWRREAPPYTDEWIEIFMSGKWTILECFRGSTKSTTLTITFSAFILGHFPFSSVLIVQSNDNKANQSSAAIARQRSRMLCRMRLRAGERTAISSRTRMKRIMASGWKRRCATT